MPTVEDLYVKGEPKEIEVLGVMLKVKQLTGQEYLDVVQCSVDSAGTQMNRRIYVAQLIKASVIEPQIEPEKLSPVAIALITAELEGMLGITEAARKKLETR